MSNYRSRKWQLTINNPLDYGMEHDSINRIINGLSPNYYCLCDETGENGTYHTHIYIHFTNARKFETIKINFESAHIEKANGSAIENRNYIRKEGKYETSDKKETNHIETFEEYGEVPEEKQGRRSDLEDIYLMINEGKSKLEILDMYPSFMRYLKNYDQVLNLKIDEVYSSKWRDLNVNYIYGPPGTGKTRSIMDKYGYNEVYRITNYKNPFDMYNYQKIIIFEEFRNSLPIKDMLNYLDGYPLILPCRFNDKRACYEEVYIISNIELKDQYTYIQDNEYQSYLALLRRIHHVYYFDNQQVHEEFVYER